MCAILALLQLSNALFVQGCDVMAICAFLRDTTAVTCKVERLIVPQKVKPALSDMMQYIFSCPSVMSNVL